MRSFIKRLARWALAPEEIKDALLEERQIAYTHALRICKSEKEHTMEEALHDLGYVVKQNWPIARVFIDGEVRTTDECRGPMFVVERSLPPEKP